jgi:hypothetical protein
MSEIYFRSKGYLWLEKSHTKKKKKLVTYGRYCESWQEPQDPWPLWALARPTTNVDHQNHGTAVVHKIHCNHGFSPNPRHCCGFFLFLGAFLFFLQDKMGKLPFLGRLDGKLQIVKKFDCGISIFFKKINKKKRKREKLS